MFILPRYILRIFWGPLILGFSVIVFVLLNQFLIKEIPTWLSKDVPLSVVFDLVSVYIASIVALAIPMAILIATLMTFGQLSEDNEITAMKASGYGLHQAIIPVFFVSTLISYGNFRFINDVLPEENFKTKKILTDISIKKPTLSFQEGIIFSDADLIKDYQLLFKKIDRTSNWVYGITIFDFTNPEIFRTLLAEKGTLTYNEQMRHIVLDLYTVEIHDIEVRNFSEYRLYTAKRYIVRIDVEQTMFQQSNIEYRGDREMNLVMMHKEIASYDSAIYQYKNDIKKLIRTKKNDVAPETEDFFTNLKIKDFVTDMEKGSYLKKRNNDSLVQKINKDPLVLNQLRIDISYLNMYKQLRNKFSVEVHKKYALPFACIIFVLIGAPLGIRARRGGIAVGTGLSIAFFLVYYAFLIGGEQVADRGLMPPWLSMWAANIIVGALGIALTVGVVSEKTFFYSSIWERRFINWLTRAK
jgi:lipopolysaccharide export system permease protein